MKPYISSDGRFHRHRAARWAKISDATLYVGDEATPLGIAIRMDEDWEVDPDLAADPAWAGLRLGGEMTFYVNWSRVATAPLAGNPAPLPLLRLPDGDVLEN